MNKRKCLIERVEALEERLRLDVEVDVLRPIVNRALARVLTLEEVDGFIEAKKKGDPIEIESSPEREACFAAALEEISMELTGQPYDRIASLPWATLKRAQRILNHGYWPRLSEDSVSWITRTDL